jgi:Glycosyl transferase family 2
MSKTKGYRKSNNNFRYREFILVTIIIELIVNAKLLISVCTNTDLTSFHNLYTTGTDRSTERNLSENRHDKQFLSSNLTYGIRQVPMTVDRYNGSYEDDESRDDNSSSSSDARDEQIIRTKSSYDTDNKTMSFDDNSSKDDSDSLAACLLVKDDNDIINEWLAYHYYTMKLRYLVVAVDPTSQSSPASIFQRWRRLTNMTIVEWSDENFVSQEFLQNGYHIPPSTVNGNAAKSKWHQGHELPEQVIADITVINNHRYRQLTFYTRCLRHMRRQNKTWVLHIDTDEYVVVNPFLRRNMQRFPDKTFGPTTVSSSSNSDRYGLPSTKTPSSIFNFFSKGMMTDDFMIQRSNHPCVSLPRLLFGSVEITGINIDLDYSSLETLRWKYHASFNDTERNARPKVIIDISKILPNDEILSSVPNNKNVFSIHRPSKRLCRGFDKIDITLFNKFPLTINHYIGSKERYFARNDTRRSIRAYESKAYIQNNIDDNWINEWINGFIQYVGQNIAHQLLEQYYI